MLWNRFVEKNRRDVEERAEQLKSIGNIAALVAGFAVVAFFEFQADWVAIPVALECVFGFTTALVVRARARRAACCMAHARACWMETDRAVEVTPASAAQPRLA